MRCSHGMRRDTRTALVMILTAFMALSAASPAAYAAPPIHVETQRPADFVDIRSVSTSIQVDIRYSGYHNFIGHPVPGYEANKCLLTRRAADAIAGVQRELVSYGLSLRVYDCYRPLPAGRQGEAAPGRLCRVAIEP